jgi:hypothetical protein
MKKALIAGIPRSGTTYLFRSICGLPQGTGTPKGNKYKKLPALKAHSLCPPDTFNDPQAEDVRRHVCNGGKTIFVFGNPHLAVISTKAKRWDNVHAANCGYFGKLSAVNIFTQDCFHYERMFDSWFKGNGNILKVKYEYLPYCHKEVEAFLSFKIKWLPWHKRATRIPINIKLPFIKTYERLYNKWQNAPVTTTEMIQWRLS